MEMEPLHPRGCEAHSRVGGALRPGGRSPAAGRSLFESGLLLHNTTELRWDAVIPEDVWEDEEHRAPSSATDRSV